MIYFSDTGLVTDRTCKRMAVVGGTVHIRLMISPAKAELGMGAGLFALHRNGASFDSVRILFSPPNIWWVYDVRVAASNGKVTIGFGTRQRGGEQ